MALHMSSQKFLQYPCKVGQFYYPHVADGDEVKAQSLPKVPGEFVAVIRLEPVAHSFNNSSRTSQEERGFLQIKVLQPYS